jgi:hypothetical protein
MLTVRVGKRRIKLRQDEVQLVEENDLDGSLNLGPRARRPSAGTPSFPPRPA